jgi:tetratricopeptide (TPR) repeat protein
MPSKVNTKFVIGLSAVLLVAVAGMAYTAYTLVSNSAADLMKAGDERAASGDMKDAVTLYSKAVNKEKTNSAYLRKWIEAMEKFTPENQLKYEKQFIEYTAAVRQLATVQPEEPANHQKFLNMQLTALRGTRYDDGSWTNFANEADAGLRAFEGKPAGEWEKLRRYRGIANARRYGASTSPDSKMREGAIADLQAAIKADPNDGESLLSLVEMYGADANRASVSRPEDANKLIAQIEQLIDGFLANSPDHPSALMAKVQFDLAKSRQGITPTTTQTQIDEVTKNFLDRNKPLLDRAVAKAKTMPMPLSDIVIRQIMMGENMLDGASRMARTEELIRIGLRAKPDSAMHMLMLAELAKQRNDYTLATEQLEKVTKLPDLPISQDGQMLFAQRNAALVQQALWSLRAWQLMPDGPDKTAAFDKAKDLRSRAASTVGADDARMLLVDAQHAFIANTPEEIQKAARLLEEYNRKTDRTDAEALLLTAQVAVQRNQPGLARDTLNRILQVQPGSITAILALAELERQFQNFDAAISFYQQALRLNPGNEQAQRGLTALQILDDPTKATDPIIAELARVNQLQERLRDQPGANQQILNELKPLGERFQFDPRVALPLAQAYMVNQQRDKAIETLEKAAAKAPDNQFLKDQLALIRVDDPIARQLLQIEGSRLEPVEKLLMKQQVYRQAGNQAKADEMLAEAVKTAPNDRRVIEGQFIDTIEKGDLASARPLAERAVRENLDGFNGDTYRARVLGVERKFAEAAAMLKGIVDRGGAQPEVHRLMGRMYALDNRPGEAATAFREAIKMRPNDPQAIVDLISALLAQDRAGEALSVARENRRYAENDVRFLKLWWGLEAQSGDRNLAIRQREQFAAMVPGDRENTIALIGLYVQASQFDKARELVDKARASKDDLEIAGMDAMLLWGTGKRDDAKKVFEAAIAKFNDPPTSRPEMMYAAFLRERGDMLAAVEAYNRARPNQDPKLMEVDRAVSDFGVSISAAGLAEGGARNVVNANADTPDRFYQKRLVEVLLGQNKLDDAQAEVDKLPKGTDADVATMILRSDVARRKGESRVALDILNEAVTRFPREYTPFMRRGEVLMQDKSTVGDAIQDFSRVIELLPDNSLGYRLRAQAHERAGDARKSESDVRAAIRVAPNDETIIFGFMSDLSSNAREEEADQVAREVLQVRPRDLGFMMRTAAFFRSRGRLDLAARWTREAFAIEQTDQIAMTYLANLLDVPRPDLAEAQRVLTELGPRVKDNPVYMMSSAKIAYAQNRAPEALKTAQDTIRMLNPQNPVEMQSWYVDMARMITDANQLRTVLNNFANQGIAPEWMAYFRAGSFLNAPEGRAEGLRILDQLATSSKNPALLRLVHNRRGEARYGGGEYELAAQAWKEGITQFPEDWGMANNLAYTYTKFLGKHEDALPLAEAASKGVPDSPDILDTLGVVYLNLNRNEEAGRTLERAGQLARTPVSTLTIAVHYVEALRRLNKTEEARQFMTRIQEVFDREKGQLPEEIRAQWDAHRDSLK